MVVTVRFFASQREKSGLHRLEVELPEGASIAELLREVIGRYPALEPSIDATRFAVNREYAPPTTILRPGDEIAFIPPVAGG